MIIYVIANGKLRVIQNDDPFNAWAFAHLAGMTYEKYTLVWFGNLDFWSWSTFTVEAGHCL